MEIKVLSREMIRPSTPTPPHLRHFKLSLFDQHDGCYYIPMVYHYPPSKTGRDIAPAVERLKSSLAKTLSVYYPLAGRIKDHKSIDCNDEGVVFVETRVDSDMSGFLKQSDVTDSLLRFVPSLGPLMDPVNTLVQVAVQVNMFSCGGFSIGSLTLHKIIDAGTVNSFMRCWAAITSGKSEDKSVFPDLTSASSMFPPREDLPLGPPILHGSYMKEGASRLRTFVFDGQAIATLKERAISDFVPHPSRVQVVSCFIWECIMRSSEALKGSKQPYVLAMARNTRQHTSPPLSEYAIGSNYWWTLVPFRSAGLAENAGKIQDLVSLVKERVVAETDGAYIQRLQGKGGFDFRSKCAEENFGFYEGVNAETILLVGLNCFRFMELDFGWGKPIWISHVRDTSGNMYLNAIILGETGCGDGIEAWVILGEKEMSMLEKDPEFLCLASLKNNITLP